MRRVLLAMLSVVLGSALLGSVASAAEPGAGTERVLVRLEEPSRAAAMDQVLRELDAAGEAPADVETYDGIPWAAIEVTPAGVDVLERSAAVADVQEDQLRTVELTSTIPIVGADDTTAAGFTGAGQTIAVLDTGVQTDHPFFAGRTVGEACFSSNGGCPGGATSASGAGSGAACTVVTPKNSCEHGTHVAGIALGSSTSPARQGVAPGASLISVQVFSPTSSSSVGAYDSDILNGLEWVRQRATTLNVAAVNLSLGGTTRYGGSCDSSNAAYKSMFDQLRGAGVAPVVSAGNEGDSTGIAAPACVSSAISVAATTDAGQLAWYSNTSTSVSLSAPGSNVTSSIPGSIYGIKSGTSMAAPHVAAAFAVLRHAVPGMTVASGLDALRATGVAVTSRESALGAITTAPRIDVHAALAPGVVTGLAATVSDRTVRLTWQAPAWTGASAISGYEITSGTPAVTTTVTETSATVTGLTNGTASTFSVVARNGAGASPAATITATPATVPQAPTITGVTAGNGRATVRWTPPTDTGGAALTGYRVTTVGGGTITAAASATSATVTGLPNGTAQTFTVAAENPAGASEASAPSDAVTPAPTVPGAPTGVTAVAGTGLATVSWSAPEDDGGSGELSYRVVVDPASVAPLEVGAVRSVTIGSLPAGTPHTFTVVATNDLGESAASSASAPVTPTAPAPAPAPAPSGGGGGGGAAPAPTTTTTTSTTTTTVVGTTPTTAPPAPVAAPAPALSPVPPPAVFVSGGVVSVRDGVPVTIPFPVPAGTTVAAAAATPTGRGAWIVTPEGRVLASGDAPALGSVQGRLNKPIVGMAATTTGRGYWLLGADGGVFTFGDAAFHGSTGAMRLNQPVRTLATTPTGRGYWLLAADGGVFTFGDARFHGSTGAMRLNQPVSGMAATPTGRGYWLVARDGGVFTFGDAPFAGAGGMGKQVVAIAASAKGRGYFLLASDGTALPYGDAVRH